MMSFQNIRDFEKIELRAFGTTAVPPLVGYPVERLGARRISGHSVRNKVKSLKKKNKNGPILFNHAVVVEELSHCSSLVSVVLA